MLHAAEAEKKQQDDRHREDLELARRVHRLVNEVVADAVAYCNEASSGPRLEIVPGPGEHQFRIAAENGDRFRISVESGARVLSAGREGAFANKRHVFIEFKYEELAGEIWFGSDAQAKFPQSDLGERVIAPIVKALIIGG